MSSTMSSLAPSLSPTTTPTASNDGSASAFSLLSLSIAAASATPIPLSDDSKSSSSADSFGTTTGLSSSVSAGYSPPHSSTMNGGMLKHHRRLSSTGKTRRRLSDARDAASRPSPASTATLSLAGLSLSSSPSLSHVGLPGSGPNCTSFSAASSALSADTLSAPPSMSTVPVTVNGGGNSMAIPIQVVPNGLPNGMQSTPPASAPAGITQAKPISINGKNGKKRGQDHKCESCSKIYRHPSCLIKHRWEHTPHWRESSKYVLSKHQQVQLLEAAAILSHLSPDSATGTSLPEDRSLWPSFLSGGTLPPPEGVNLSTSVGSNTSYTHTQAQTQAGSYVPTHPSSSSVPATSVLKSISSGSTASTNSSVAATSVCAPPAGPRLHDYTVSGGMDMTVTQVRPGLLMMGASPSPASTPIPMPPTQTDSNGSGGSFTGAGIGYGIHGRERAGEREREREREGRDTTSTSVPFPSGMVSSSSPYYNPRVGSVGPDSSAVGSMPVRTTRSSTRSRSKSISKYHGKGHTPSSSSYGNNTATTASSSSFTTASNGFAPSSYTSTGTSLSLSLSLPRSSLRSGSVGGSDKEDAHINGRGRGRDMEDSDVELDEDDEEESNKRYNDDEFEDDEDMDDIGRGKRVTYARGTRGMSSGFDEYAYEHERGMGINGKRISPPLKSMKEEEGEGDWEMEMEMDMD